tara:strand:- start:1253 stop:1486 length:234 start_codon:yes stop_codon:yes gene_type:complete
MEKDNDLMKILEDLLDDVFPNSMEKHFDDKKPQVIYENIEDYTTKTGKRFRMNKDQKERGLDREEAFGELFPTKDNE